MLELMNNWRRLLQIKKALTQLGELTRGTNTRILGPIGFADSVNGKTCSLKIGCNSFVRGTIIFERDGASLCIGNNVSINTVQNGNMNFLTNDTERVRIAADGKVIIHNALVLKAASGENYFLLTVNDKGEVSTHLVDTETLFANEN